MKICPNCGGFNDSAVRFCSACGSPSPGSTPAPATGFSPLKMLLVIGLAIFGVVAMLSALVFSELPGAVGDLGRTIGAISGKPTSHNVIRSGITMQDFL